MFIKLEVLLLSAFFCIIILLGGGIWIGTAMTENLYVDLEPNKPLSKWVVHATTVNRSNLC